MRCLFYVKSNKELKKVHEQDLADNIMEFKMMGTVALESFSNGVIDRRIINQPIIFRRIVGSETLTGEAMFIYDHDYDISKLKL